MSWFLIDHRHEPEHCVAIRKAVVEWAHEPPTGLRDIYWEPGAHRGWFVVEAERNLDLQDIIGTIVETSTNVIHAVLGKEELIEVDREAQGAQANDPAAPPAH